MRVCSQPGCPTLIEKVGRCVEHAQASERARGSRQARGYGATHEKLRAEWKPRVEAGTVLCARCKEPIVFGQPWHLDHDDRDRTKYLGPSHMSCNTAAGGRAAHPASDPQMTPF